MHQYHIPQCTILWLQKGALWDICLVPCGICMMDLFVVVSYEWINVIYLHIDDLVQDSSVASVLATKILQPYTKQSTHSPLTSVQM